MRVTAVHRYPNGTTEDTTQQTTFEYDANSVAPGFSQNVSGRLAVAKSFAATVTGGVSVTSTFYEMYSYDSAGRVLKKRLRIVNPVLGTVDKDIEYNFTQAKLNTVKYPDVNVPFTYYYDNMLRPNRMTGKDPNDFQSGTNVVDYVNSVNYNVASRMTSMWALGTGTSTYTYNERFELTRQQTGSLADIQYEYSATADNGQILSRTNNIAAEKVAYQYDSLKRLISASATNTSNNSTNWASTYGYDGWGNLLSKTPTAGSAPTLSVTVNGLTNRINSGGYTYDNNGNMTSSGTFDVDNRLATASGESYGYLTNNQRVYKRDASGNEWIYFHDASGKRIMTFQMQNSSGTLVVAGGSKNVSFVGRSIILNDAPVVTDRLGSVLSRAGAAVDYFPYGEEKIVTTNPAEKFGTYLRDATGLDYANERYYNSAVGRFLSNDPYQASGGGVESGSWNRYAYVTGDPINWNDPWGLNVENPMCMIDGIETSCGLLSRLLSAGGGALVSGSAMVNGILYTNQPPQMVRNWETEQWEQLQQRGIYVPDLASFLLAVSDLGGSSGNKREDVRYRNYQKCLAKAEANSTAWLAEAQAWWADNSSMAASLELSASKGAIAGAFEGIPAWIVGNVSMGAAANALFGAIIGATMATGTTALTWPLLQGSWIQIGNVVISAVAEVGNQLAARTCSDNFGYQ